LKKGSSLIDKGVLIDDVDYKGAAPDLGCFESDYTTNGILGNTVSTMSLSDKVDVYAISGTLLGQYSIDEISAIPHGVYIIKTQDSTKKTYKIAR
jgi:hypothetical protein